MGRIGRARRAERLDPEQTELRPVRRFRRISAGRRRRGRPGIEETPVEENDEADHGAEPIARVREDTGPRSALGECTCPRNGLLWTCRLHGKGP